MFDGILETLTMVKVSRMPPKMQQLLRVGRHSGRAAPAVPAAPEGTASTAGPPRRRQAHGGQPEAAGHGATWRWRVAGARPATFYPCARRAAPSPGRQLGRAVPPKGLNRRQGKGQPRAAPGTPHRLVRVGGGLGVRADGMSRPPAVARRTAGPPEEGCAKSSIVTPKSTCARKRARRAARP